MAETLAPLVCAGTAVDRETLAPVGQPCGAEFHGRAVVIGQAVSPGRLVYTGTPPTEAEQLDQARAAGWSVTGPPMCPRCRRPDPAIARGLTTTPSTKEQQ